MSVCAQDLKDPKFLHFERRWRKDYFNINDEENKENKNNEPNPSQEINFQIEERKEIEINPVNLPINEENSFPT